MPSDSERFPEGAVAIALVAQKVDTMIEGLVRVEGKVDNLDAKLEKKVGDLDTKIDNKVSDLDKKFEGKLRDLDKDINNHDRLLVGQRAVSKSLRYDVNEAKKKIDDVPEGTRRFIASHEKACPSREATITRLAKNSRPPKDTPKEIKRPSVSEPIDMVKWLIYGAALIGVGIAAFLYFYHKLSGGAP